ncbi:hypothetical protein [Rhizobium arsenicireducens]
MKRIFEIIIRFRTWLANLIFALLLVAPDLLNSPEIIAIIPTEYQRWVIAAGFLVNIWMRPRPAVLPTDLEASISRSRCR